MFHMRRASTVYGDRGQFFLGPEDGAGSGDEFLDGDSAGTPEPEEPGDTSHARPDGDDSESGQDDDLRAVNEDSPDDDGLLRRKLGKEARLREKAESQLADVAGRLIALEESRARQAAQPQQARQERPFSDAQLKKIMTEGTIEEYHEASERVRRWELDSVRMEAREGAREELRLGRLDEYMNKHLQVPQEHADAVQRESEALQKRFNLPLEQAQYLAKTRVGLEALNAKPEKGPSLRDESLQREGRNGPQVRRGKRATSRGDDTVDVGNISPAAREGLMRSELWEKYTTPLKNARDEKIRVENLKRALDRYKELNDDPHEGFSRKRGIR